MSSRVYCANIGYDTTADDFYEHLERIGCKGVASVDFRLRDDGRSKGFALVSFNTPQNAQSSLARIHGSELNSRQMRAQLSTQNKMNEEELEQIGKTGQLYVSDIPQNVNSDQLRAYFEGFGGISDCVVLTNPNNGKSRGVAFVTFESPQLAKHCVVREHRIGNKLLRFAPQAKKNAGANKNKKRTGQLHITLPTGVSEDTLRSVLEPHGAVTSIKLLDHQVICVAIVVFDSVRNARSARDALHDTELPGYEGKLVVRLNGEEAQQTTPVNKKETNNNTQQRHYINDNNSSKEQIAASHFFDGCVFDGDQVKPWADTNKRNVSLDAVLSHLNNGATCIGDERARILYDWSLLFQHLSEAPKWDDQGRTVDFQSAFVLSGAVERLVEGCFVSPFSAPVSQDALPAPCELTVTELACKVFESVFVGEASLHRRLVDGIVKLAELEGVPPELPGKLAELFGCFKIDTTDDVTMGSQTQTIEDELPAGGRVDSNSISLLEDKWRAVLKQAGVGHVGDVGKIYQTLSALMGDMTAAVSSDLTSSRQLTASLTADLAVARGEIGGEVAITTNRLDDVEGELGDLGRRKDKLTGEMEDVLKRLDSLEKRQEEIEKGRREAVEMHREPLLKIDARRKSATVVLVEEEKKASLLSKAMANLEAANMHISAKQNKGNKNQPTQDLSGLAQSTVAAAREELTSILQNATKLRDRRDFCHSKLTSMQMEQQEMQALEFDDIARDITKGMEGLNRELEVTSTELKSKVEQANKLFQWLRAVTDSGAMRRSDLADIPAIHAGIQSLA